MVLRLGKANQQDRRGRCNQEDDVHDAIESVSGTRGVTEGETGRVAAGFHLVIAFILPGHVERGKE